MGLMLAIGLFLVVRPSVGASYLERRMKRSLFYSGLYKKMDEKELVKYRKYLKVGSVFLGLGILTMVIWGYLVA